MCCYHDPEALKNYVERMRKRGKKTFYGWKVVTDEGKAGCVGRFKYKPGINKAKGLQTTNGVYMIGCPRGIHVYTSKSSAEWENMGRGKIVKVECGVKDLIAMESPRRLSRQAVLTKVRITKADWKKAGLK